MSVLVPEEERSMTVSLSWPTADKCQWKASQQLHRVSGSDAIWEVSTQQPQRGEWNLAELPVRLSSSRYRHRQGFRTLTTVNMSKVNRGSHGCRAMVIARKYLSGPSSPVLTRSSSQRQRKMLSRQHRMASCNAAGTEGNPAALAQQEHLGYFSTGGRHAKTSLNLIYRDVKAFLSEVGGDPREARYWLTQFQKATSAHSPAFAVLEVKFYSPKDKNKQTNKDIRIGFMFVDMNSITRTNTLKRNHQILVHFLNKRWINTAKNISMYLNNQQKTDSSVKKNYSY